MDYSRKGVKEKQKELKSTGARFSTKMNVMAFRITIVAVVTVCCVVVFAAAGLIKGLFESAPSLEDINVEPSSYYTTIYDSEGKVIQNLIGSDANREAVENIEDIPQHVRYAFIAIEDERFYEHDGIDVRGIFRAGVVGLLSSDLSQGASTITQQLIKNLVFEGGNEKSDVAKVERKLQEQYLAVQLEGMMDKDTILLNYLNTINLGANTLGVQTASKRYFNKDVSELTISEAAVIAAITKNPSALNPIEDPEDNGARRATILKNMNKFGYITDEEYQEALDDNVYERIQEVNALYKQTDTGVNSYFVDAMYYQVIEDLQEELGYSYTQAVNKVYRGGLQIYSTQDSGIQKVIDDIVNDESNYPSEYDKNKYELTYALSVELPNGEVKNFSEGHLKNYFVEVQGRSKFNLFFSDKEKATPYIEEYKAYVLEKYNATYILDRATFILQPEISFTLIDQYTGQVVAIVGGRGEKTASLTLNRASTSKRQPGSTFKVVSTFLPAIDACGQTLATLHKDAPYTYPNGRPIRDWRSYYKGNITIRESIWDSNNVTSVKTLEEVGLDTAYSYLKNLGFTTLVASDMDLPMALGGLTYGVTNVELTGAYATIANGGYYYEPLYYTKIVDMDGNVLIDKTNRNGKQVMYPSTAYLLTSAMQDVVTKGTGKLANFDYNGIPIAGKTGTTSSTYDLWFAGYTPYYTAALWSGYDNNNAKQTDGSYHKGLWAKLMKAVCEYKQLEYRDFEMPDSVVEVKICKKCGNLAKAGSSSYKEYFAKGSEPDDYCTCIKEEPQEEGTSVPSDTNTSAPDEELEDETLFN